MVVVVVVVVVVLLLVVVTKSRTRSTLTTYSSCTYHGRLAVEYLLSRYLLCLSLLSQAAAGAARHGPRAAGACGGHHAPTGRAPRERALTRRANPNPDPNSNPNPNPNPNPNLRANRLTTEALGLDHCAAPLEVLDLGEN